MAPQLRGQPDLHLFRPGMPLHAGVDTAQVVVCTVPDDVLQGTMNRKIVEAVRLINPDAIIIANVVEAGETARLYAAGADNVSLQRIETAMAAVYGVPGPRAGVMNGIASGIRAGTVWPAAPR